jgi:hypothetical protein
VAEEQERHNNFFIDIKQESMNKKILITLLLLPLAQAIQAQNNAIFFGGAGDGHALVSYLQTLNETNKGGDGDGWAMLHYAQASSNISLGGDGDGWGSLSFLQGGDTSMFLGGDGDGSMANGYVQIADSALFRGGDGDGWASIVLPVGPLPLELLSFTAQLQGDYHLLKWQTSIELNSSHFVIEHSSNAKLFTELGMRNAAGQSNMPLDYEFINKNPLKGNNFYRIRMIDADGKFKHSNVVLLKNLIDKSSIALYPNPASSMLYVDIMNIANNSIVTMHMIDVAGKTIWKSRNQHKVTTYQIDISKYASGIYQLWIETPAGTQTIKFNKL